MNGVDIFYLLLLITQILLISIHSINILYIIQMKRISHRNKSNIVHLCSPSSAKSKKCATKDISTNIGNNQNKHARDSSATTNNNNMNIQHNNQNRNRKAMLCYDHEYVIDIKNMSNQLNVNMNVNVKSGNRLM